MRPIEDIISEKAYSELTEQELLEVAELAANEEEYNQMKRFFDSFATEVQTGYSFQASPAVKESLDNIFMAKHPVIANDWNKEEDAAETPIIPIYRRRSVQIAAILLLCLGAAPLLFKQETSFNLKEKQENTLAKQEVSTKSAEEESALSDISTPADLPAGVKTNDNHSTYTASAEAKWAEDADRSATVKDGYFKGLVDDETPGKVFSLSEGLQADLDPNLRDASSTVSGNAMNDKTKAVTAAASGSEMLDWIQAAY